MKKNSAKALLGILVFTVCFGNILSASAATDTHDQTVNFSVDDTITMGGDANVSFSGNLAPGGSALSADGNVTISTNADGGFSVAIERNTDRTAALQHSVAFTDFPDKTVWNSSTNNSETWSGDGFGFRLKETGTYACAFNSTWWGADASPKYAGIPNLNASNKILGSCTTAQTNTLRTLVVEYRAEAPGSQTSGLYQGVIRYTGTTL